MDLEILLSSGETDTFSGADETVIEDHYLHVLVEIEVDEIAEGTKTLSITTELQPGEGVVPPQGDPQDRKRTDGWQAPGYLRPHMAATKTKTYRVAATYAPGMWMKVVYQ